MTLRIDAHELKGLQAKLRTWERQVPYATSVALNETAKLVQAREVREMQDVFDRPTPFILKSLRVLYATKQKLEAAVWFKDVYGRFGAAVGNTLLHNIQGGGRAAKASEVRLRRAGILAGGEWLVPSRTAPLDRYGNVRGSEMVRILSDLMAFREAGFTANRRSTRKVQYVMGKVGDTKGIFKIKGGFSKAATGRWSLIFLVVGAPRYQKRFHFYEVGQREFARVYKTRFVRALDRAIATAK